MQNTKRGLCLSVSPVHHQRTCRFFLPLAVLLFIFLQQILCTNPCVICINSLHYYTRNLDYILYNIFTCNLRILSALLYPRSLPLGRSRAALLRKLHALLVCARAFLWRIVPFRLFIGMSICLAVLVVSMRSLSPLSLWLSSTVSSISSTRLSSTLTCWTEELAETTLEGKSLYPRAEVVVHAIACNRGSSILL